MVYKGELIISGKLTKVAVKRLNERYGQGLKEFLTEIQLLSGQKHPNLISLIGYCDEGKEKLIVYEYAERGSLDRYLRRSNTIHTLGWLERLKICIDAARGLDYLHNHVGEYLTIIHRDIKSANILIGENWVAKVSDLGLSKLSLAGLNRSEVVSHVCGTNGYCEPEYYRTNIVKKESDVYSFGMVLFEVFCGRLCTIEENDGFVFSCQVVKGYYEENKLDEIVDPNIKEGLNLDSMNKFAAIAYGCLHDDRGERPPMSVVVKELEESLKLQSSSTNDDGKESEWESSEESEAERESQSSSSKSYSKRESQNSSSSSPEETESQSSNSKSYSMEELMRSEKVMRIFQQFDLNRDGCLNREELKALLVATNTDLKNYSQEQFSIELDVVFHLYSKFIDGEKGLTFDGLLQIYKHDLDGDLDFDFEALRFESKPYNHIEPNFRSAWERPEKVRRILNLFDLNKDGCLNRNELANFIVATHPNVQFCISEISNCVDDFLDSYEEYINGEKGLNVNGLLLSYDEGDGDLDFDFEALGLELNPYIDNEVVLMLRPRRR